MEIFGGFMVMMSIISFFLAVVWLVMPFVVFAIKGKQDRTLEVLETMEKRLAFIEGRLQPVVLNHPLVDPDTSIAPAAAPSDLSPIHTDEQSIQTAAGKDGSETSPVA